MFDDLVDEPTQCGDERMPEWVFDGARFDGARFDDAPVDGNLDAELERLLAEGDGSGGWPPWAPDLTDQGVPPPTYGTCDPSGWLAFELDDATANPTRLPDPDLIDAIIGFDRLASWAAARQARLLAELAVRRPADAVAHVARTAGQASEYAPDEVGVALHLARGTAAARIAFACRLLSVLPETHARWETGRIDTPKARAIDDATAVLSDEKARAVQARVLPRAPEQTLAQLKAALTRAILAADPKGADDRHREARRDRRVIITPETEGMASLWALLTATDAAGAYTWLTRLARGLGPDDPRSMDTRRADLLAALLNGRLITHPDDHTETSDEGRAADGHTQQNNTAHPGPADPGPTDPGSGDPAAGAAGRPIHPVAPGKPLIQIVMAHSTLTGADDHPAELVGHGPIPAALAREVAADAVWRRLVTEPLSGTVLDYGRTTYHPPAALADHVRVRDLHCRFPGCRRTATDAELDHAHPWAAGGPTSAANLHALCLHHHLLKGHAGWTITPHPDGRLTWTTPTGHRHTTRPHDYGPEPPAPPPPPEPAREPAPRATRRPGGPERPSTSTADLIATWSAQPARLDPDPDPLPF